MTSSTPRNHATPPDSVPQLAAQVIDVVREYGTGTSSVRALDGVNLSLRARQFTAIMGASGSGKSTLLHCLAGLDQPTSGRILLGDTELGQLNDTDLTETRRERIGFVFQDGNLLPHLTAGENIDLGASLSGKRPKRAWRSELADRLGIADRLGHLPAELSGGQRQRVAVARALLGRPDIIVADEPTGALDSASGATLLELLRACVDDFGQTVVMVTHDPTAAAVTDEVVLLKDGRESGILRGPTRSSVLQHLDALATSAPAAATGGGQR